jgi:hypothetical protein
MKTNVLIGAGLLALCAAPGARLAAQPPSPWLHVRVEEPAKGSRVHVNLPLNVVEVALKAAPEAIASKGRINFGREGHGMALADFRRIWGELKSAGDTDLVTVEEKDENVRVGRKGGLVEVRVERKGKEEVKVEIPVEVVDALFSGEGDELNVKAALAQLQTRRGDIVRVNDEHSTVRIWIDEKN